MIANLNISPDRIARFCHDWKISELALFGSVLRDDFGPDSDIDLLVTFEPDARWSLFDIVRLKREFETIVIDTPPILGASESLVFSKVADSVIFCSLRDVSRVRQVRVAIDRLEHAGAKVAGTVLCGMPVHHYAYAYGYYGDHDN